MTYDDENLARSTKWMDMHPADVTAWNEMPFKKVAVCFAALCRADEALLGVLNQPRCTDAADEWLQNGPMDYISSKRQALVDTARRKPILSKDDYAAACEIAMGYESICNMSDPGEMAVVICELIGRKPINWAT